MPLVMGATAASASGSGAGSSAWAGGMGDTVASGPEGEGRFGVAEERGGGGVGVELWWAVRAAPGGGALTSVGGRDRAGRVHWGCRRDEVGLSRGVECG